ncbi:MAG: hypothetical protein V1899_08440 [Planctomycetota bacterium]
MQVKQRLLILRGALRRACAFDGLARLVLAVVICALIGILLDYFFFRRDCVINTSFRILMTLGALGALSALIYCRIYLPCRVPLSVDDMALSVEREFPQLNDSLISSIQLVRSIADDRAVSAAMIEEVARQASQQSAALDFSRVVKLERVKPIAISAITAVGFLLMLLAVPALQSYLVTGMLRLFNPLSNAVYPVRTFIHIKGEGKESLVVPRNDSLKIVAVVTGDLPKKAKIYFDYGYDNDGGNREFHEDRRGFSKGEIITTVSSDSVNGEKARRFEYEYNPVLASFRFYIEAGDNESNVVLVRVVDRPELKNFEVAYELPKYIEAAEWNSGTAVWKHERSLRNVIGAKAHLKGKANKPLKEVMLKLGDAAPAPVAVEEDRFATNIMLDTTKDYEFFIADYDGLDNRNNKIRHKIWVIPDQLPKVLWRAPAMDLEVAPAVTVSLALALEDDWGLRKASIKFKRYKAVPAPDVTRAGAQSPAIEMNSSYAEGSFDLDPKVGAFGPAARKLDIEKDWRLAELGLQSGDIVEYWAEACDWCPDSRKGSDPQLYRLRVLSIEEMKRRLDIERLRLIDDLKAIIQEQESDKKKVDAVKDHLGFGNPFDNSERNRVSEAGVLQEDVRRKTQSLQNAVISLISRYRANDLDTPDETNRLDEIGRVLLDNHSLKMPDASKNITATATAKEDTDRLASLKKASAKQSEILADLKSLLDQMQKWAETEELLRLTRELLLKQRVITRLTDQSKDHLGNKKPAAMTNDEKGQIKALEIEQRDCVTNMAALNVRMLQALAKMQELDKWVAKNINDAIRIAQNSDATPENPDLAVTGDPHPSIEDKLRAAQNDIRLKDKENIASDFGIAGSKQRGAETGLERMIIVLSRRREMDQQLLKDISQTRRELQRILDRQRQLTQKTDNIMAEAAKEKDLGAAEELKRLQDQQKALRDEVLRLQKKLDQLRDKTGHQNAERASQANQSAGRNQSQAAGRMGQGDQSGTKSAQKDAEQDLQDALDNLDQLDRQMQQQNRNEQLFQIEQELKKMLGTQKDVLNRTQDIEKLRGKSDEPLKRGAKLQCKQVFGDQQKLSDSTRVVIKKLEESPVFQWVLQTVRDDMSESAVRLDKEETGVVAQEIQEDVIKKLGELIEALKREQQKKNRGGGGGGGGGQQPLVPPLAELKMLKIMQRDVNARTKKIDEEVARMQGANKSLSKDQKDRLRRAATKEGEIARITNKIADDLNGGKD